MSNRAERIMFVLGVSALYHDAAAALVGDDGIIAAAQEERFTRKKNDPSLPLHAIRYCMKEGNVTADDIDAVVYYDNPIMTLDRFMSNLEYAGTDCKDLMELSMESLLVDKLWVHDALRDIIGGLGNEDVLYATKHHIAHAASAFYPSPFRDAAILTVDGVGEWTTTSIGYGEGNQIRLYKEIEYPHSLGLLYSAFTYFCGFKVNSGEYKLMGLAPYGEPKYVSIIKDNLIDLKDDGSYQLNLEYFDYQYGRAMTNEKFSKLFGGSQRTPESRITKREMDLAASIQKVTEEAILLLAEQAKKMFGDRTDHLVMAGGVALNCVANGILQKKSIFSDMWIQPAAGDAGGALGAALYYYWTKSGRERAADGIHDMQYGSYLGPHFEEEQIEEFLKTNKYQYHYYEKNDLFDTIARLLDEGKVIGIFEGRMEYGPRALGNRSIIADPRSSEMQSKLNLKIKYRESFRPFAPSVLEEDREQYFEIAVKSPYMLLCAEVKYNRRKSFDIVQLQKKMDEDDLLAIINTPRSDIPAVTHVDYSARLQTVSKETNPFFHELIETFKKRTGYGVLINTSFNVRGEPIVCSPRDAYLCFMRTGMDVLVMGNCILWKEEQPELGKDIDWRGQYALD